MQDIIKFLIEKESEMVSLLKEIVEQESPSLDKELTDRLGVWLAEQFTRLTEGKAEIIPSEPYGNHIRAEWGEGKSQLLIATHFDTVWPKGTITRKPFKIEDGKAYGPGVFDMKGGIIQGLYALHAIQTLGKRLNKKIVFLFTSDEEIGSTTSRALIEAEAAKSEKVFILEPAIDAALKTSRKGVGMFKLSVTGIPAHSGADPEKGVSAIGELAEQIRYLHSLTDFTIGTTVNVGTIKGGTTSNVVAANAEAAIDLRVKTQAEFDRIIPLITGLTPINQRAGLEVTGGINRPPFERTDKVAEMFQKAKSLAKEYLDYDLEEKATGGASDGNFTGPIAPTLDGLGAVGDGAHAEHEHLVVKEMPIRSALLALLLMEYGQ